MKYINDICYILNSMLCYFSSQCIDVIFSNLCCDSDRIEMAGAISSLVEGIMEKIFIAMGYLIV